MDMHNPHAPDSHEPVESALEAMRAVLGRPDNTIALHEPEFSGHEWDYVKSCIDTGWVSSVGSFVDRFERDLCGVTGARYAIATANGTAALHVSLLVSGVQAGDEVLMPTLTFIATANAVSYAGAVPHFLDSEDVTLGVCPEALEAHLKDIAELRDGQCVNRVTGRVIRALVVMHVFGHPCAMDSIVALANRWGLALIEDAAESLGSLYHGRHTGNMGLTAALSFNGNKLVTTGGGGAVLTNNSAVARRAKHLSTTARVAHRWSFVHDDIGFNYRLPNINAALGCAQLEQLEGFIVRKRQLALAYQRAFRTVEGIRVLVEPSETRSNYWLNTLVLDPRLAHQRDHYLAALNDAGFMSRPLWTLMHKLDMYTACPRADLSRAESLESRVINVPSSPRLADLPGARSLAGASGAGPDAATGVDP